MRASKRLRGALLLGAAALTNAFGATAQELRRDGSPPRSEPTVGVVIVAHGGPESWNAPVLELGRALSAHLPVEVVFLMGAAVEEHRFPEAVRRLAERGVARVVVVPLLVSSHGEHFRQIARMAGADASAAPPMSHAHGEAPAMDPPGSAPPPPDLEMLLAEPLGASPELVAVLGMRGRDLAEAPAGQALYVIGHGPNDDGDYAAAVREMETLRAALARDAGFAEVAVGLLRDDAPPRVRAAQVAGIRAEIDAMHGRTGRPVVVVPLLVSRGTVATAHLPADLEGLPVVYTGVPLLPHPALRAWVERQVREADRGGRASGGHDGPGGGG